MGDGSININSKSFFIIFITPLAVSNNIEYVTLKSVTYLLKK